jgi:hypothetical protein
MVLASVSGKMETAGSRNEYINRKRLRHAFPGTLRIIQKDFLSIGNSLLYSKARCPKERHHKWFFGRQLKLTESLPCLYNSEKMGPSIFHRIYMKKSWIFLKA